MNKKKMTRERKPTYEELEQRLALAEKALRENEWRDRQLIDTLNEGIWRIDAEGRTTFVNPRMAEMLGYTAEEMQGEHLFAFMDREWANEAGKNLKRREQGISEQHEFLFRKKSGETIYALLNTSPVLDQTGAYAGALAGVTDITIRRRAEQALRKSEERLKLALHGADLGMWDWDLQTGGIAFNEQWAEMLGYGLDEIEPNLGAWENLVHPDDMPGVREVLNAHLQGKTDSYEAEFRMRHKSGAWVWILDKGRVIERDREGKPLRACGTHLDITSQRQAREKISRSEELFRKFFETSVNYCYMISPEGVILDVNPAALKALKYERDELLGQPLSTIYSHESQARRMEIFEKWKRTGHIRNEEMIIQAKSGERRTVLLSAGNVLDPDGKPLHSVSVQTDITDRKLAEEALRRSEEKFRSIAEQTSDVIALTDHKGVITYVSRSCEQVFGSAPDEMTGRHFTEFLDESVIPVAIKAFRESIEEGRYVASLIMLCGWRETEGGYNPPTPPKD